MILALFFLLLMGGVAQAQVVSPMLAPPVIVTQGAVPSGGPPQIVGYSAANTPESETVVGDMTFARTGTSQYTATVSKINGVAVGGLATMNIGTGLVAGGGSTLNLVVPVSIASGGTGGITAPVTGQILIAQSATAYAPMPVAGDITLAANGIVAVTKVNGATPGGTCSANQFVNSVNSSGVPACAAPNITGTPNGAPPQIIGYSATNIAESETVSGGPGNCTYTRTGTNAYRLTCSAYATTANPTFTGTVTMPDGSTWSSTTLTGASATFVNLSATNMSVANLNITSGTGGINLPVGGIYYQPGYNPPALPAYWDQYGIQKMEKIGIGQAVGNDPLDITANVNGPAFITVLNNNTGTSAYAALNLTNGTNTARIQLGGTALTATGVQGPNTLTIWSDQGIGYSSHNSLSHQFAINGVVQATIAANGLHLTTPLEVTSGGTGTAAAPTQNQILVAQSGSAYAPVTASGDLTITSTGAVTVSQMSGNTVIPWTPTLGVLSGTGAASITYGRQRGVYFTLGPVFFFSFDVQWTAMSGGGSGLVTINGLPVTQSSTLNAAVNVPAGAFYGINLAGNPANTVLLCNLGSGSNSFLVSATGSSTLGYTAMSYPNLTSSGEVACQGWGQTSG